MTKIIGRKAEQKSLKKILNSKKAEFLAIYGRRRIGKTFLIREYFRDKKCIFFQVIGKKDGNMAVQLKIFTEALEETFYSNLGIKIQEPQNWHEAFSVLTRAINEFAPRKKIILFFDELPWLATRSRLLLESLLV